MYCSTLRNGLVHSSCTDYDSSFSFINGVGSGMVSTLLRTIASSRKAFYVASPTFNDGVTDDGGCIKMVVISVATCFKKSSSDTLRNSTSFGKNSTVSQFLSSLILRKYTVTQP